MATNPSARMRRHEAKFILVWPGDDIAQPGYGGMIAAVPPAGEVAVTTAPNSPYRFPAAEDGDGAIPGTVLLKSVLVPDLATGGFRSEFDATDWCDGIETTAMGKGLVARGLTILDGSATREDVQAAQAEGRPKWEAAQEAQWNETLSRELGRQERLRAQNRPITTPTNDKAVRAAIAGLEMLRQSRAERVVSTDTIRQAMGLDRQAPAATVTPFPAPAPKPEPQPELRDLSKFLLATAQKNNVRLTNAETMGLFEKNEEVMRAVEVKLANNGVDVAAEMG